MRSDGPHLQVHVDRGLGPVQSCQWSFGDPRTEPVNTISTLKRIRKKNLPRARSIWVSSSCHHPSSGVCGGWTKKKYFNCQCASGGGKRILGLETLHLNRLKPHPSIITAVWCYGSSSADAGAGCSYFNSFVLSLVLSLGSYIAWWWPPLGYGCIRMVLLCK